MRHQRGRVIEWLWRKAELAVVGGVMAWLWVWATVVPRDKDTTRPRGNVKRRPASTTS